MLIDLVGLPRLKRQVKIRVGRGIGSGKGKTSGRGVKGQKARTGHHSVKGFEGGQTPIHMRLPKRGFVNTCKTFCEVVTLSSVLNLIKKSSLKGKSITKEELQRAGLIKDASACVKLISSPLKEGDFEVKIVVDKYSKNAKKYSQ